MIPTEPEPDRIPRRPIIEGAVVTVIVTSACVLATWWIGDCGAVSLRAPHTAVQGSAPTQVNAVEAELFDELTSGELDRLARRRRLESYGWVDPDRGIVHVPIELAIERYLVEEGGR